MGFMGNLKVQRRSLDKLILTGASWAKSYCFRKVDAAHQVNWE